MAKTTAERQAAYRKNRAFAGDTGDRRLNTYISTSAALALHNLANIRGINKRELLETLLLAEQEHYLATIEPDSPEWHAYFGHPGVTP